MTSHLPHTNQSSRRLDELFDRIVNDILEMYNHEISEQEAIEAARNWLGFCEKVIEIDKNMEKQVLEP